MHGICAFVARSGKRAPVAILAQGLAAAIMLAAPGPAGGAQDLARPSQPSADVSESTRTTIPGTWAGRLVVPGGPVLTLLFHVQPAPGGGFVATMDSPDQGAVGIPVDWVGFEEGRLRLDVAVIGARYEGVPDSTGGFTGTWSQGPGALPLDLERVARPGVRRPQEPAPPYRYFSEAVRYRNDEAGIELAGTLTIPPGDGPFPAVVLISGSGPQDRDSELYGHRWFLVLADHLTRQGIVVLRSDDRGVGQSGGDFNEATTLDFASDAAAAVAYLRRRDEVRADAIGLVGMSEGGVVAPIVAVGSADVAFIVLLAGPGLPGEDILYLQSALVARAMGAPDEQVAYNRRLQGQLFEVIKAEEDRATRIQRMDSVLRRQVAELPEDERLAAGFTPEVAEEWVERQITSFSGPWFRYFLIHDPRPVLRQVTVPVLAINGTLDLQVPSEVNLQAIEEALREAGNERVTLIELPGLNHLMQTARTGVPAEYADIEETISPTVLELVSAWILERAGR